LKLKEAAMLADCGAGDKRILALLQQSLLQIAAIYYSCSGQRVYLLLYCQVFL
jgi:hypothetical protein